MKGIRCKRCHRWWGRHRLEPVADGVTDNTCAFQHELGTYKVSQGIRIPKKNKVTFRGNRIIKASVDDGRWRVTELLTADERDALRLSGELAGAIRRVIGEGPTAVHDWSEAALHIHNLQHMVMAQAAARGYPGEFRLLGRTLETSDDDQSHTAEGA